MKPDESYKALQKKLLHLIKTNNLTSERTKVKKQLEKKFMAAWQFAPDRLRLGAKLATAIDHFKTREGKPVRGFEHENIYTGEYDRRIIVTQPYGSSAAEITQDLTLNDGVCPEVIDATEWAFYYPEHANLFIVKFPPDFQKSMNDFERSLRQAEIKKALKAEERELDYFDVGEVA